MSTVNIHEAKTHLSRLVDEVSKGREILIAKSGKPMARLSGLASPRPARKPGFLKGKIRISDDFDSPLSDDLLDAFQGKS